MRNYADRICDICGDCFSPNTGNQRFCPMCRSVLDKVRRHSKDPVPIARAIVMKKNEDRAKGCEGCKYWRVLNASFYACHYLLDNSQSRGCPPGNECLVREESKPLLRHGSANCRVVKRFH